MCNHHTADPKKQCMDAKTHYSKTIINKLTPQDQSNRPGRNLAKADLPSQNASYNFKPALFPLGPMRPINIPHIYLVYFSHDKPLLLS